MNKRKRTKNRNNAGRLSRVARLKTLAAHTCENCGEKGGHWVSTRGMSVLALISGVDDQQGFWTCPKLYDKNGRRVEP